MDDAEGVHDTTRERLPAGARLLPGDCSHRSVLQRATEPFRMVGSRPTTRGADSAAALLSRVPQRTADHRAPGEQMRCVLRLEFPTTPPSVAEPPLAGTIAGDLSIGPGVSSGAIAARVFPAQYRIVRPAGRRARNATVNEV